MSDDELMALNGKSVDEVEELMSANLLSKPKYTIGSLSDDLVEGVLLDGYYEINNGFADFVISDIEKVSGASNSAMKNVINKFEEMSKSSGAYEIRIQFNYVLNDRLKTDPNWAKIYGYDYKFIPSETGPGNVVWTKIITLKK